MLAEMKPVHQEQMTSSQNRHILYLPLPLCQSLPKSVRHKLPGKTDTARHCAEKGLQGDRAAAQGQLEPLHSRWSGVSCSNTSVCADLGWECAVRGTDAVV